MDKITREENERGVTLIALIVTVLVLAIIAGIGVSSGFQTVDTIKLNAFYDELQLIQARVDVIYEQIQLGEKAISDLGGETYENAKGIMDRTFDELNDTSINRGDYRYYTRQKLNNYLGIEDATQSVLINWITRDIISVEGIKKDGIRYYRYQGANKPIYSESVAKDIQIIATKEVEGDINKITVQVTEAENVEKEITSFTLKYKLYGENVWKIADDNYFETAITGRYIIEVSGEGIISNQKIVSLYNLEGYQEVEYIESKGAQYLEIDYIASNNTNSKGVFQITDVSNARILFGSRVSSTSRAYALNWGGDSPFRLYNTYGTGVVTTKKIDTNKHSFQKKGLELYIDEILITTHTAVEDFTTPYNMIVFGCNTNGTIGLFSSAKMYSLQFFEEKTLAVDLVPCYKTVEGATVIGMYDVVNNKFYENKGTGTFNKGNDI